jgi:FHA domain/DUF1707 SHOCT-like domain
MRSTGGTLPPVHVSDAERERALRQLREAAVQGRLSNDSFVRRLDDALRSRNRDDLADLLRDLPGHSRLQNAVVRRVRETSLWLLRVRHAWQQPRLARLSLPADGGRAYWLGRNPESDLVLSNRTVSRSHARLNLGPDGWMLTDLGSTNGTRVNGWIVTRPQIVRPGDRVSFGSQTVVLTR